MSVTVSWQDPHCIRYQFEGTWDWNQLYEAYKKARAMERASGRKADVIIDMQTDICCGLSDCQYVTGNPFIYALLEKNRGSRKPARAATHTPQPVRPSNRLR